MKKEVLGLFLMMSAVAFLGITSCSPSLLENETPVTNEVTGPSRTYHSKDGSEAFLLFMQNPEENTVASRSARAARSLSGEPYVPTEEDMFAEMWESLSDSEKQMLKENAEDALVSFDSVLAVDEGSPVARSVSLGDDSVLSNMTALFGFTAVLEEWFEGKELPLSVVYAENDMPEDFTVAPDATVPAALGIEMLSKNEDWDAVAECLSMLDIDITVADIKNEYKKIEESLVSSVHEAQSRASSVLGGPHDTALRRDVGKTLKNGTVLLTSGSKRPYLFGTYGHAGIFSESAFRAKGETDAAHCVYTAQPYDSYFNELPTDMLPDRTGHACLDTIYMYTKETRFASIIPKNYSDEKAKQAVSYAKSIFYDTNAEYWCPLWEAIWLGDSSHNEQSSFTYCSKVAYTAWKKAGVNLDGNTFAGNLVSPDDLYGSSVDRYFYLTIRILWWSKTFSWKTYSATSNVVEALNR